MSSVPEGALVIVDGQVVARTPTGRVEVEPGTHRVQVQHSHFAPFDARIAFDRGDHLVRSVELVAGEGTFEFLSNPRGSWVEVNGERLSGVTPITHTMASGEHRVRMGQDERRPKEKTITLKHGEQQRVQYNLGIEPHGTLRVRAVPGDAALEFIDQSFTYQPNMRLPIGEYQLRVSRKGYVAQEVTVDVLYGDNTPTVRLGREQAPLNVVIQPSDAEVLISFSDAGRDQRLNYQQGMRVATGRVELQARAMGYRTQRKRIQLAGQGATVRFQLERIQVTTGATLQDTLKVGGRGPDMVVLPAGAFAMGDANGTLSEKPVRTVSLTEPFAMSKYEVTTQQYLQFARSTGRSVSDKLPQDEPQRAVSHVSFEDAAAYASWLSEQTGATYRLPSESEWEYAARAGSSGDYFFGDDPSALCRYGNIADRTARKRFRDWGRDRLRRWCR